MSYFVTTESSDRHRFDIKVEWETEEPIDDLSTQYQLSDVLNIHLNLHKSNQRLFVAECGYPTVEVELEASQAITVNCCEVLCDDHHDPRTSTRSDHVMTMITEFLKTIGIPAEHERPSGAAAIFEAVQSTAKSSCINKQMPSNGSVNVNMYVLDETVMLEFNKILERMHNKDDQAEIDEDEDDGELDEDDENHEDEDNNNNEDEDEDNDQDWDEEIDRVTRESIEADDGVNFIPASKSAIEELEKVKLDSLESATTHGLSCAICKEGFDQEDEATRLPCLHIYHRDCIVPWLEMNNKCPLCRYAMPHE